MSELLQWKFDMFKQETSWQDPIIIDLTQSFSLQVSQNGQGQIVKKSVDKSISNFAIQCRRIVSCL